MFKDYYKILAIPKDASRKLIRKAYAKIALECHPDRTAHMADLSAQQREDRKEIFIAATEAHSVLINEAKRKEYDAEIERARKSGSAERTPPPRPRTPHERPTGAWKAPKPPPKPPAFSWEDVERMVNQKRYTPLFQFCANRWRDYDLRVKVGMRLIDHFVEYKNSGGLRELAKLADIPPEIRNLAFEKFTQVTIESFNTAGFLAFLEIAADQTQDRETKLRSCMRMIDACRQNGRMSALETLATYPGIPKEISDAAYETIADLVVPDVDSSLAKTFIQMTLDKGRDENVRIRAGLKFIKTCAVQGNGGLILTICLSSDIPSAVRNAAFEKIPEISAETPMPPKIFERFISLIEEGDFDTDIKKRAGLRLVDGCKEKDNDNLFLIAERKSVPAEVRAAAYVKLADWINEKTVPGYFFKLIKITGDKSLDESVRLSTGMRMLDAACTYNWALQVMKLSDAPDIPENLRIEAFRRIPVLVAVNEDKNLLPEFVKRTLEFAQAPESKTAAFERFVGICVENRQWEKAMELIFFPNLPEEIQKRLKEKYQEALEEKARQLALDGNISGFIELISNKHVPEVLRIDKGLKGVDLFARQGMFRLLLRWGNNEVPGIPEKVRQSAIEKLAMAISQPEVVERLVVQEQYDVLLVVLKNENVPPDLQMDAGMRMIKTVSQKGKWGLLVKWSKDKMLPAGFSLACHENISNALLNGKVVDAYFKNRQYGNVISMIIDPDIPDNIRECTGLSAVKCFEKECKYDLLSILSRDDAVTTVPESVKRAAKTALEDAVKSTELDLEKRYLDLDIKMRHETVTTFPKNKGKKKAPV